MSSRKPPGPACPPDHKHAQNSTCYKTHNCRCTPCRAHSAAKAVRRYRLKAYGLPTSHTIPITGARRRIQALIAIGWTHVQLSRALGRSDGDIWRITAAITEQITIERHNTIAALFDKFWNQTPPQHPRLGNRQVERSIAHAKARGWLPPLAWDDIDTDPEPPHVESTPFVDEIAIALALEGHPVPLRQAEREEAVRLLVARKLNDHEIAALIGVTVRTIERIRKRLDIPTPIGRDRLPIAS